MIENNKSHGDCRTEPTLLDEGNEGSAGWGRGSACPGVGSLEDGLQLLADCLHACLVLGEGGGLLLQLLHRRRAGGGGSCGRCGCGVQDVIHIPKEV